MNENKKVLVTGATGQQGGAVTRHLLAAGWSVRALTRNVNSPAALAIVDSGAEVVQGNLADRASLDQALDGVHGVFSFPNMAQGIEAEIQQGKLLADSAGSAGVQHFVQGTVGGAERHSGVPHFESKRRIEEHILALGLPATFLRPTYFMENLYWKRASILDGSYESMGLDPDRSVQMIAADDIGAFAALVFANPEEYIGRALEIAGDELTEPQMVETMAKVIGRPVELLPGAGSPAYEDMAIMVGWFNEKGYEADIRALRQIYPGLMSFEMWLGQNGQWRVNGKQ
jgi:uncharacterized protein YbjT (DUF2867 family)